MEIDNKQESETTVKGVPSSSAPVQKLEIEMVTEDYTRDIPHLPRVNVALHPRSLGPKVGKVRPLPLWHRVLPRSGARISLTSSENRARVVRLTVRGETEGWKPEWVHWTYAVRHVSELKGGPAVAAQDVLIADERTLDLLLLPVEIRDGKPIQERREVTLAFEAMLDEWNQPGDYDFTVLCTELESGRETGAVTTLAGRLRFHHPDTALLEMLPSIYYEAMREQRSVLVHQDGTEPGSREQWVVDESVDRPFFERYLRGYEDAIDPMRDTLSRLYQYFGAYTTPGDFIPWLATWVGLTLDENWPEMKRRRLIREAIELYRKRGTRKGLARYLEIYADVQPQIHDQPTVGMRLGKETRLGSNTRLGGLAPHTFVVTLAVPDPGIINEKIVRQIIESQKPAHTHYLLRIARRDPGRI